MTNYQNNQNIPSPPPPTNLKFSLKIKYLEGYSILLYS